MQMVKAVFVCTESKINVGLLQCSFYLIAHFTDLIQSTIKQTILNITAPIKSILLRIRHIFIFFLRATFENYFQITCNGKE
jgi:hypothetical protein